MARISVFYGKIANGDVIVIVSIISNLTIGLALEILSVVLANSHGNDYNNMT